MNEFQESIQSPQLTLVDFYATWCGPCKMMQPVLEQLQAVMRNQIHIVKVDMDEHQDIGTMYHVLSIPTLILFRNGQTLWRHTGYIPLPDLKRAIQPYV